MRLPLSALLCGALVGCPSPTPTPAPPTLVLATDADGDGVDDSEDCDDGDATVFPGATETCDGLDNDCDGEVDEGVEVQFWPDVDGDGAGDENAQPTSACEVPAGSVTNDNDCDDGITAINPDATEVCNDLDDDCSGLVDDGLTVFDYWPDADQDGFGDASAEPETRCNPPANAVDNDLDCNDAASDVNPDAVELCNGVDDDCAGGIDDGLVFLDLWPDGDGDGFGDTDAAAVSACEPTIGFIDNNDDCDDVGASVNPGATEICNDIDDNCDEEVDEGFEQVPHWPDLDGDGFGDLTADPILSCEPPPQTATDDTDCDDGNDEVNPGAEEILDDGVDNDCNPATSDTDCWPGLPILGVTLPTGGGPEGLRFGPDCGLYVARGSEILRIPASDTSVVETVLTRAGADFQGVEFGPDGLLYAASRGENAILRFDPLDGSFVDLFADTGFDGPNTSVFGPDGSLYVTSRNTGGVYSFEPDGTANGLFATSPDLGSPEALAFGPDGALWVSARIGNRIQRFDASTGVLLDTPLASPDIDSPEGLVFTEGVLYVVSRDNDQVLQVDIDTYGILETISVPGSPIGLTLAPNGDVIIGTRDDRVISTLP